MKLQILKMKTSYHIMEDLRMFEHILVPTDFSEKSKKALEIAVKMTRYEDIHKVTLLHVI